MNPHLRQAVISNFYVFGLIILSACGGSSNNNEVNDPLPPFVYSGSIINHTMTSAITGITYPIHVYLPPSYQNNAQIYPVIYATDGQWRFDIYAQAIEKKHKELVLVAIDEGPQGRRNIDFLLPAAPDYYQFLISELLPDMESRYNIDSENRTLVGASFGGLFVGLALLFEEQNPAPFINYWSFDGSFGTDQAETQILAQQRKTANEYMSVNLFLSGATMGGNDIVVNRFKTMLEQLQFVGLTIHKQSYAVVHSEIAPPSFNDALDLVF
jgi:predicted alpha/beta superfamily hydrolase